MSTIDSGIETTDALNGKLNLEPGNNRLVGKDSNNVLRLVLSGENNQFSMKISEDGVNVDQATDEQLTFNSEKIRGTASITPPSPMNGGTPSTIAIAHNLGYKPMFRVFVENPVLAGVALVSPGLTNLPSTVFIANGGNIILHSYANVDNTNLYINLVYLGTANATGLNAYTWNYSYEIDKAGSSS